MWLSSLVITGAINDSDTPVTIENVIIKARYKSGLFVDPSQVRIFMMCMSRARMKIKCQARTEHMFNKASATLFCRYSKRRIKSHYVYRLNYKRF
ncbi:hypothetical protein Hanom_Chr01g00035751 [Helianthus anomalus]